MHPVAQVSHLAHLGIVKFRTAAEDVQLLVTQAQVPASHVVVEPTVTVAAVPVSHVSPLSPLSHLGI